MSNQQMLKIMINERLSKAAEEIFVLFEQSVAEYQREIDRLKNASEPKHMQVVLGPDLSSGGAQQTQTVGQEDEENEISCRFKEEAEQLMITREDKSQMMITNVQTLVNGDEVQPQSQQINVNSEGAGERGSGGGETDNSFEPTSESEEEESDTDSDDPFGPAVTEKPFRCPVCKKRFHQKRGVKMHMRWAHAKEEPLTSTQQDSEQHSLQPDMETFEDRPFSCTVCKREFKLKLTLDKHMRKHTGGNPYSCKICGASFPGHVDFICHMKTVHAIENPFKCSVCNKGLKNVRNYRTHMLIHTGERPYLCSVCGRGFLQSGNLRYHMLTHTGEKPFNCSDCGAKYTSKQNLMNHKKANH